MSTAISSHPLYYLHYTTSIPSPKIYKPFSKSYEKGLRLSTPFSHREQVEQHISRCSPPELPFTDSPLSDPILWVQSEDHRLSPKPSSWEAKAWQATSVGTATCIKHLPAPLGHGNPPDAQLQGPKGLPRPTGTLGGNTLTGTDHMFRGMVSNKEHKLFNQLQSYWTQWDWAKDQVISRTWMSGEGRHTGWAHKSTWAMSISSIPWISGIDDPNPGADDLPQASANQSISLGILQVWGQQCWPSQVEVLIQVWWLVLEDWESL